MSHFHQPASQLLALGRRHTWLMCLVLHWSRRRPLKESVAQPTDEAGETPFLLPPRRAASDTCQFVRCAALLLRTQQTSSWRSSCVQRFQRPTVLRSVATIRFRRLRSRASGVAHPLVLRHMPMLRVVKRRRRISAHAGHVDRLAESRVHDGRAHRRDGRRDVATGFAHKVEATTCCRRFHHVKKNFFFQPRKFFSTCRDFEIKKFFSTDHVKKFFQPVAISESKIFCKHVKKIFNT